MWVNAIRISENSQNQIVKASEQRTNQAETVKKQLTQATPEQISNLLKRQGRSLEGKKPEEVKKQLISQVSNAKEQIKN